MSPAELGSFWGPYAGCFPIWLVPLLPDVFVGRTHAAGGLAVVAVAGVWSVLWALLLSMPVHWAVDRWARRSGHEGARAGVVAFAVGFVSGAASAALTFGVVHSELL